jgi:hypothetical protein
MSRRLRRLGLAVGWLQIVFYGLMLTAGAAGVAYVAWRQSPTGTIVLVVVVAVIGLIAWASNRPR